MQRTSPKRSFKGVGLGEIETKLSLQLDPTTQTRKTQIFADAAIATAACIRLLRKEKFLDLASVVKAVINHASPLGRGWLMSDSTGTNVVYSQLLIKDLRHENAAMLRSYEDRPLYLLFHLHRCVSDNRSLTPAQSMNDFMQEKP